MLSFGVWFLLPASVSASIFVLREDIILFFFFEKYRYINEFQRLINGESFKKRGYFLASKASSAVDDKQSKWILQLITD